MNGGIKVIRSHEGSKETGIVWGFNFQYPDELFVGNFDWRVIHPDGRVLEFEAYMMRKLYDPQGKPFLNMRFRDRGWTVQPKEAKLVAELHSPAA